MATSYSGRVARAQKVLAEYNTQKPNTIAISGTDRKTGEPVKPYSINDVAAEMAEALRAMIEISEPTPTPDLSGYKLPGFGNMQEALDSLTIRPVR